ncbi:MAG: NCS2 family permease [Puniceicoccales bacterium]
MKRWVKGDVDGLFALGLDNLIMLLLINSLALGVLGFDPELFFTRMLPGNAVGLIVGNLYFAGLARKLGKKENRDDVCAIPYGINIFTIIVFTFAVMLPVKLDALSSGASEADAIRAAWGAGVMAAVVSGAVEFLGAFCASWIRRVTPRAALLSAIGGVGLLFIGTDYFFRAYSFPLVGIITLLLTLILYFGRMRVRGGVPGGMLVLIVGVILAWTQWGVTGAGPAASLHLSFDHLGFFLPVPVLGEIVASLPYLLPYSPVILTMGLLSLMGSLMNLESAAAAGDCYPTKGPLLVNGLGSILTGVFGSPYPTTIYIGHPGWKKIGARAGYSSMSGVLFTVLLCTGSISLLSGIIPIEAGMAILIWIGLTIASQAFEAVPRKHIPAVTIGFVPALAAYTLLTMQRTWGSLGFGAGGASLPADYTAFDQQGLYAGGIFALNAGYLYTCMILSAMVCCIIDGRFRTGAIWALAGVALAGVGFIHSFQFSSAGYRETLFQSPEWAIYYLIAAGFLFVAPLVFRPEDERCGDSS